MRISIRIPTVWPTIETGQATPVRRVRVGSETTSPLKRSSAGSRAGAEASGGGSGDDMGTALIVMAILPPGVLTLSRTHPWTVSVPPRLQSASQKKGRDSQ